MRFVSAQIIIFHHPGFPWNKGMSLTKPTFWGEVVWGRYNLTRFVWLKGLSGLGGLLYVGEICAHGSEAHPKKDRSYDFGYV